MNKKVGTKLASVTLFVHGFIETVGAVALIALPSEFLITAGYAPKEGKIIFMAAFAAIFGLSRLAAGYVTWSMKKWGIAFGMVLSMITMIVAPLMHLFGDINLSSVVMDLLLAVIVLASLLYASFGSEKL